MKGHLGKNSITTILSFINGTYTIYIHTALFIKINSNKALLLSFSIRDLDSPGHPFDTVWKHSFSHFFSLKYSLFSILSHSSNNTVAFSSSDFLGTERYRLNQTAGFHRAKIEALSRKETRYIWEKQLDFLHLNMTFCDLILAAVLITLHTGCPRQTWLAEYGSPGWVSTSPWY